MASVSFSSYQVLAANSNNRTPPKNGRTPLVLAQDSAAEIARIESDFGKIGRAGGSNLLLPSNCIASLLQKFDGQRRNELPIELYSQYELSEAIERELSDQQNHGTMSANARLARIYEDMEINGGTRYVLSPPAVEAFEVLRDEVPNFQEVIRDIELDAHLYTAADEPMKMTPILLLGGPGIGKTHFAKTLSRIMGSGYKFISFSSLTAGWILSGANPLWTGAREGDVANTLLYGDYANPVIVLDEVDKAGGDSRYDTLGSLYNLLEKDTAQVYSDEFVQVKMDASHILWVATANYEEQIPEPILNRMRVYVIPPPNEEATRRIALRIYRNFLNENPKLKLGRVSDNYGFGDNLSEEVYSKLTQIPPRKMRDAIQYAMGLAVSNKRWELKASDIQVARFSGKKRNAIGFNN